MELTLKQAMSSHPLTVRSGDSLSNAYRQMKREGYRHLPVLDNNSNLVGIISDRDFQRAMWPIPTLCAGELAEGPVFRRDSKVSDYMSWPVRSLSQEDNLMTAVRIMIDEKISAIVITQHDKMIGIMTHEDLLRILAVFLKEPESIRERAVALAYNSPLSKVSDFLASIGV